MPIFDTDVRQLDVMGSVYSAFKQAIFYDFVARGTRRGGEATSPADFIAIYRAASAIYRNQFPKIWNDYVPIYLSVWDQTPEQVNTDNVHQDRSVYHFGAGDYSSRMINLWIAIHKHGLPAADDTGLGIFIVEPGSQSNDQLYEKMKAAKAHFFLKRPGQFVDNTYIAGTVLRHDNNDLRRHALPYSEGTAITFNSHFLHGSTPVGPQFMPSAAIEARRIAVSSVWVHRADFNYDILDLSPGMYKDLFLRPHAPDMRDDILRMFADDCGNEERTMERISALARHHLDGALVRGHE